MKPNTQKPEGPHVSARLARLLSILIILRAKEWVSASELAERFGVSYRTIYRDVEAMQHHGIPVQGVPGPDGGYRLGTENPLPSIIFGSEEATNLSLLGATGPAPTIPFEASANKDVLARPGSDTRAEVRELLRRASTRIYFDTSDWYWRDEGTGLFSQIREAVFQQHKIVLSYRERGTDEVRSFRYAAYGLVWKVGQWYVVGVQDHDQKATRLRLGRIASVKPLDETFEVDSNFRLGSWWQEELEQFGKGSIKVELRVAPGAQEEMRNLATKNDSQVKFDGEMMLITLFVDHWEWLVPLILSFATSVVVEQPIALRNRVVEALEKGLENYLKAQPLVLAPATNSDIRSRASKRSRDI